jgi:hypothetical protein
VASGQFSYNARVSFVARVFNGSFNFGGFTAAGGEV